MTEYVNVTTTCFTMATARTAVSLHDNHYIDVIMGAMASQITSLKIVHSTVYSGEDQRKHQNFTSLTFVRGIHRWPVNSPHKWSVTRKMFHWVTSSGHFINTDVLLGLFQQNTLLNHLKFLKLFVLTRCTCLINKLPAITWITCRIHGSRALYHPDKYLRVLW